MARIESDIFSFFSDVAQDNSWSRPKQIEVLLAFIDDQGLEAELSEYVRSCHEDDDIEESDDIDYDEE